MDWLPLSLLCALSLASADAATKQWLRGYRVREISLIRFNLAGLLLIPLLRMQPLPPLSLHFWGWMPFLVPMEMAAMLLYMGAIRDHPLALTASYPAFTPLFSGAEALPRYQERPPGRWLVLRERLTLGGIGGILLVVLGAWILNLKPAADGWRPRPSPTGPRLTSAPPLSRPRSASVTGRRISSWGPASRVRW